MYAHRVTNLLVYQENKLQMDPVCTVDHYPRAKIVDWCAKNPSRFNQAIDFPSLTTFHLSRTFVFGKPC